jgi:hypothetical protein
VVVDEPPLGSPARDHENRPIRRRPRRRRRWATALAAVLLVAAGAGLKTIADRSGLSWNRLPIRIVWAAQADGRSDTIALPTPDAAPRADDQLTFAVFDQPSPPTDGVATSPVQAEPRIVEAVWHTPRATNPATEKLLPSNTEASAEADATSDRLELPDASRPLRIEDFESPELADANDKPRDHTADTCAATDNKLGTSIEWIANVEDAARLAKEQDKLVFLIQVSGNFAREEFT